MKHARMPLLVGLVLAGSLLTAQGAQATGRSVDPATNSTPCANKLVSSHEGFTKFTDGDTVASQEAAFGIGANLADTDLWVTIDGYIVQMHDNDVSHSTDGTGLVTEMTLAQIQALHTRRYHEPIPTLGDSLAIPAARDPGRYLMVETKFSFAKQVNLQKLSDEITAAGMTEHVLIYSAYLDQVTALKQLNPALIVFYKAGGVPPIEQVQGLNGVMIAPSDLSPEVVTQFHDAGIMVMKEREKETAASWSKFVTSGADALMTDSPKKIIKLCRSLG